MEKGTNAELAYRVLDHIDAHPRQWDQTTWIRDGECGTTACFAGWTVLLSGHRVEYCHNYVSYCGTIDGDHVSVRAVAARDLGIPLEVAWWSELFAGGVTRDQLGRLVEQIFGPRPS
jgi:hypothetical protein